MRPSHRATFQTLLRKAVLSHINRNAAYVVSSGYDGIVRTDLEIIAFCTLEIHREALGAGQRNPQGRCVCPP